MSELDDLDTSRLPGYAWMENGQSVLSGPLLDLDGRLDALYLRWARKVGAEEWRFPVFLPARDLDKLDYFQSFPHLVTFPVTLDADPKNLERFRASKPLGPDGRVTLANQAPIRDVLTPAACYHFYRQFQGERLPAARYVTTRATCFRRETRYRPLQRQWSFSMREIVCLGSAAEVQTFLDAMQARVDNFVRRIGVKIEWKPATDPFFNPSRSPRYLAQRLDPVKKEMVFRDRLAIGSVNLHRNYFGETFDIQRNGEPAYTGCVAFGLERWIAAWVSTFGPDAHNWPDETRLEA